MSSRLQLSLLLRRDAMAWANGIIDKTWKKNPQNVYNLAAIAGAVIILIVSIRLGMSYLKYGPL
jgi:hypothetical protein